MIIDKIGKYKLLKDIKTGNSISTGTIPRGTILNITQVDKQGQKVIGAPLADWTRWELPVEFLE